jgi:hypothetical protein
MRYIPNSPSTELTYDIISDIWSYRGVIYRRVELPFATAAFASCDGGGTLGIIVALHVFKTTTLNQLYFLNSIMFA